MSEYLSYSQVKLFTECKRKFYYRYVLKISPKELPTPFKVGTMGHLLLETFLKALSEGKSKEEAIAVMDEKHREEVRQDMDYLPAYFLVRKYIDDFDSSIPVEIESDLESDIPGLSTPIKFRADVVVNHIVEDFKFISRQWESFRKSRYRQIHLYIFLLRRLGYRIDGGRVRFFHLTTNDPNKALTYQNIMPSEQELNRFIVEFRDLAEQVLEFKSWEAEKQELKATRNLNEVACRGCPYLMPCLLQEQGKDITSTIKAFFDQEL